MSSNEDTSNDRDQPSEDVQLLYVNYPLYEAVQLFGAARDEASHILEPGSDPATEIELAKALLLTTAILKLNETLEEAKGSPRK